MKSTTHKQKSFPTESSELQVKVRSLGSGTRLAWDCLIMFGEGKTQQFREAVEAAKSSEIEEGFMLAIGQSRLDGDKSDFENVAVEYATTMGTSPPDWDEVHTTTKKTENKSVLLDVGNIIESNIVEATIKMMMPQPMTLDLANTIKSDASGIDLFNEALESRIDGKLKTKIINGDRLIKHFIEKVKSFPSSQNEHVWSIIFNYCKLNNLKDIFEQSSKLFSAQGGKSPAWKDLSDHENEDRFNSYEAMGIDLGESLSKLGREFARECIDKSKNQNGSIKKELSIDFAKTRKGSLLDTERVIDFLIDMEEEGISVNALNVNEIFIEMFKLMGVHSHFKSVKPPGIPR